jgi:hypothetical protein
LKEIGSGMIFRKEVVSMGAIPVVDGFKMNVAHQEKKINIIKILKMI